MSQSCTGSTTGISPRAALQALNGRLRLTHHRGLVWISGDQAAVKRTLGNLLAGGTGTTLWVGDDAPDGVTVVDAHGLSGWLGAECDALVFDARNGFEPDAFGALSGTLRGGGVLYLLTPSVDLWLNQPTGSSCGCRGYFVDRGRNSTADSGRFTLPPRGPSAPGHLPGLSPSPCLPPWAGFTLSPRGPSLPPWAGFTLPY